MMKRRYLIPVIVILMALLLAACSAGAAPDEEVAATDHEAATEHHDEEEVAEAHGDEDHAEGEEDDHAHASSSHDTIHGAREIRVVAHEWGFEPASIHLHEGEPVNIVLVNEGALEHEIELGAFDFHVHTQPGETMTAGFVPQETGSFEFGCYVPGHFEAGMVGELVVEAEH